jgi:ABC-type multidrug transport system ATPase subunit
MWQGVAIRAEGLVKAMGARTVLRSIDLSVFAGQCVVLRGDNGSGKTTLLRCLAGLARLDAGLVRWFGRSPTDPAARRMIGMVAHQSHLYPHLTLGENLMLIGRLQGLRDPVRRTSRWLEFAGLEQHSDRLPGEVSQGMRRRASLARALVHDPPILLLDEPFSGLDPAGQEWLWQILWERVSQGRATCLVTHEDTPPGWLPHCGLELRSGRLWPSKPPVEEQESVAVGSSNDLPPACPARVAT